ncbi:MAG: sugar ABC transporter substrate-binding protein, partial [Acinetobacter sp.]
MVKKVISVCLTVFLLLAFQSIATAESAITLTVMNVQSSSDETSNAVIAEFEAANPSITIEHISTVNAELKKQIKISMLAGNMPDVVMFDNPDYASFASSGYLLDITDYVSQWSTKPNYYDAAINAVTYKGRLYGLPFESNSLGLWYNKTMLDKLNKEIPTTWDDVLDISKSAKEQGYFGLAIAAPQSEVCTFQFIPWLYAAGGTIDALNTPEAEKALSFLTELVSNGYMSKEILGYSHGDLTKSFQGGNVAMMVNGSWCISGLADSPTFEYGVTTLPVVNKGDLPTTCLGGYHIGISADCKNVEAAMKYIEFMASADTNLTWCMAKGLLPTNTNTAANEAFQSAPMNMFVKGLPGAIARV